MTFRITILCDNSVGAHSGTLGEHGFSALVEPSGGTPLLFDTGQGQTLLHNAGRMNKDLSHLSQIVISHGHFDHTGGLKALLETYGPRPVYCHPAIFKARYRIKDTGECYPISVPVSRAELEQAGADFELSSEFRTIAPQIHLTGEVPRTTTFETGDQGLYCDCAGQVRDATPDDQSLILETTKGLVLLLGCCHSGLINTLEHSIRKTGRRDIYAIIGGTHLGFCRPGQLEATISRLHTLGIQKLAVSHCTGFAASTRLQREFPKEFQLASVGYTLQV